MTKTETLRALVQSDKTLIGMGAHDPLCARMIEQAGYDIVYLGGFAAAAAMLGEPDLGLLTLPEMADHIRRVAAVISLPIIADADNGHGGALNVARTVSMFEAAGASGFHMEDQVLPKKCGHLAGKAVIPVKDMVQKLRAAQAARHDPNFFIIARTDAIAVEGIGPAIERAKHYAEAGADALFLDAPESMEHLEQICTELEGAGKPLVFNAASTGKTPTLSIDECQRLGFDIVLYPIEPLLAAMDGTRAVLSAIKENGNLQNVRSRMSTFDNIRQVLGFPAAEAFESQYPVGR